MVTDLATDLVTALECTALAKAYPGVLALDGLDFSAEGGTVHAVLGENGAGKSTFIKVLGGAVRPDGGRIALFGREAAIRTVAESRRAGVSVAYQELSLVPDLTVGQNIWLNRSGKGRLGLVTEREAARRTEELCARIGAPAFDPRRKVKELSIAARHVVEIVAALASDPKVLILDEATAALPAAEAEWALELARKVAAGGALVLFISHRLHECRAVASRYTVLRRCRRIVSGDLAGASDEEIIEAMLGRKPKMLYPPPEAPPGAAVRLSVRDLSAGRELRGLSFDLHAGEILGVGGLEGQGQAALMLALFGMKRARGAIAVDGRPVRIGSPAAAFRRGIALVPEDRRYQGLHLERSIRDNIALPVLSRISRLGFVPPSADRRLALEAVRQLDIKAASVDSPAKSLSGGNQQKVVVAKLLATGPQILLFHDLTRGIDVGAKAEIFRLARRLAAEGRAILFYSSENQELVNLCDRVLVLRQGQIVATLAGDDRTEENVLHASLVRPGPEHRRQGSG